MGRGKISEKNMKFNGILQINDTLNSLFWENDRFSSKLPKWCFSESIFWLHHVTKVLLNSCLLLMRNRCRIISATHFDIYGEHCREGFWGIKLPKKRVNKIFYIWSLQIIYVNWWCLSLLWRHPFTAIVPLNCKRGKIEKIFL